MPEHEGTTMPIVDAHPHIYSPDRKAYPAIAEPWEPGEPASAEDLKLKMDVVGVDRAVFIQTGTFYGHDNRYIMAAAKEHADWACGVVTLDPDDHSHVDLLEEAVTSSNIRGMRGTADSINRISSPNVYRLWSKAMDLGIPVNCMVMDDLDRVPEIERIAQDLGGLKIVIDHCLMLNTRQRTEETLLALDRLARLPNVYAKLTSGTHGSYRVYPYVDMHGPLKRVIEAFGPDRCVWGSNFPNALWSKGASYAQNLHLFVKELGLSLPDKADILGGTAMGLWFPKEQAQDLRRAREQKERTEREVYLSSEDDGSDEAVGDAEHSAVEARAAEVTNIADLLTARDHEPVKMDGNGQPDDTEDGILDMSALMDAASELSAMLGPVAGKASTSPERATKKLKPEAETRQSRPKVTKGQPLSSIVEGEPVAGVNIVELLAAQNYTPIKTDEIGQDDPVDPIGRPDGAEDGEFDMTALMDVADQLNAMLTSIDGLAGEAASIAEEAGAAESGLEETGGHEADSRSVSG